MSPRAGRRQRFARLALVVICGLAGTPAVADEGGVSYWLPGNFGSFAATPSDPGWSLPMIYYSMSADAHGSRSFPVGERITAGLNADGDLLFILPTYTFKNPVMGAQAAVTVGGAYGRIGAEIEATLTGPGGDVVTGRETDSHTGFSDLYPMATLKWNHGVHNTMIYGALGVPVGDYDASRLANTGTNHWAVDAGGGYTYLDEKTGREFSTALGLTYNFENPDTDYQNGIDIHLDWAASQFFSENFHAGLVGYFYNQLTGDSGAGAVLGDFKSRVAGIGPQAGWFVPVSDTKWYVNLKGFYEFNAKNRPEGWNAWLALAIPL